MRGYLNLWGVYHYTYPGKELKALFFDYTNAKKWANAQMKAEEAEGEYEHDWEVDGITTKDQVEMKSISLEPCEGGKPPSLSKRKKR